MKIKLDSTAAEWQQKARDFAEQELIPCEVEAEMNGGSLPAEVCKRHKKRAIELGFSSMDAPRQYGGLQLRNVDQVAVWEQLGRVTNALCWCFSEPHQWMFQACNEDQLQRYVLPLMDGSRKECYAITESESGSDVRIDTTATPCGGGYLISGEKWFVTSANLADYFFIQAKLAGGPHAGHDAMFLLDKATAGIEEVRSPLFSHTFDHHHPILRFNKVFVPVENRLGAEGGGMELQPQLVPPRATDDCRQVLRRHGAHDRGGHCLCADPDGRWRAIDRQATGASHAGRQRNGPVGLTPDYV